MSLPDLSRNSSNMSLMINLSCSYSSLFVTARNASIVHSHIQLTHFCIGFIPAHGGQGKVLVSNMLCRDDTKSVRDLCVFLTISADNTQKRVWQYIEKEKKKKDLYSDGYVPIHIDIITMGLPIVLFKGSQVEFSKFDVFLSMKVVLIFSKFSKNGVHRTAGFIGQVVLRQLYSSSDRHLIRKKLSICSCYQSSV